MDIYIYKRNHAKANSFAQLTNETNEFGKYHCLDTFIDRNIDSMSQYQIKDGWVGLGGPAYYIWLSIHSVNWYCGHVQSYSGGDMVFFWKDDKYRGVWYLVNTQL